MVDPRTILDPLVRTCAEDLFLYHDVRIHPGGDVPVLDRVAVIGFMGDGVRGSLGLGISLELMQSAAAAARTASDAKLDLDDWLGEMANQLLGRLKNRLLTFGPAVGLALPMVLRGLQIEFVPDTADVWTYPFHADAGSLCIWLDVRLSPEVELTETADPELSAPAEGDLVVF